MPLQSNERNIKQWIVYVNKSLLIDRIVNEVVNKKVVNKLRVDTVLLGKAGKMLKRFRMWPAFRPKTAFFFFSSIEIQRSKLHNLWYPLCMSLYISIPKHSGSPDAL